jgi:hypothetical protein
LCAQAITTQSSTDDSCTSLETAAPAVRSSALGLRNHSVQERPRRSCRSKAARRGAQVRCRDVDFANRIRLGGQPSKQRRSGRAPWSSIVGCVQSLAAVIASYGSSCPEITSVESDVDAALAASRVDEVGSQDDGVSPGRARPSATMLHQIPSSIPPRRLCNPCAESASCWFGV